LRKGILHPGSSDVGGTIVEYCVALEMLEMLAQRGSALVCGDVALESDASRDRFDWGEIDTDNEGMRGHNLECLACRRMVLGRVTYL
jgi:hypothetical protein